MMFDIVAGCCQDSTMDLASYVILQVQIIIISPVYYFSGMFEFLQLFARVQHNTNGGEQIIKATIHGQ